MSFTVGERISVNNLLAPPTKDGHIPEVLCDVTAVAKRHVLAKVISVTDGAVFAVKDDGNHVLITAGKLPALAQPLEIGDVTALPFVDVIKAGKRSAGRSALTRDEVKQRLQFSDENLDDAVRKALLTPMSDGMFLARDVEAIETFITNREKEQKKFGDKAQEFNRLGRELHPQFFDKAW